MSNLKLEMWAVRHNKDKERTNELGVEVEAICNLRRKENSDLPTYFLLDQFSILDFQIVKSDTEEKLRI